MTTIVFHSQCPDGWTAAWVAWHYYTDQGEMPTLHPGVYGEPAPDFAGIADETVVIVDFSYPPAELVALCERAESVIWLDHHASAINAWDHHVSVGGKWPVNLRIDLDLDRSGALITWDYFVDPDGLRDAWWPFHESRSARHLYDPIEMREIVERVDDRDRWVHTLYGTAEVFAALTSRPYTIEAWDEAFALGLDGLVAEGASIVRYRDRLIEQAVENAYQTTVAGHLVHVANVPYAIGSDVAGRLNEMWPGEPFSGYWFTDGTEQKWGLRSGPDGVDVSKIAAMFGGGGHVHAAGFRIPDGALGDGLADPWYGASEIES